jgi:hypothetical protein
MTGKPIPISFPPSRGECRSTVMSAKSVANVSGTGTEMLSNLPSVTTLSGLTTPGCEPPRGTAAEEVGSSSDRLPRYEGGNTAKSACVRDYTTPYNISNRFQSNLASVNDTSISVYIEHRNPVMVLVSMEREISKDCAQGSFSRGVKVRAPPSRITANSSVDESPRDGKDLKRL